MWHMGTGWGWWMVFGWIWMVIFWGIIVWGVLALARGGFIRRPGPPSHTEPRALDVLERRYASGELTDDEFERMRRVLLGAPDTRSNPERVGSRES